MRAITNVRDLVTFRRFLSLLASHHGQVLNKTDLAAPRGGSVPTIGDWLSIRPHVSCKSLVSKTRIIDLDDLRMHNTKR